MKKDDENLYTAYKVAMDEIAANVVAASEIIPQVDYVGFSIYTILLADACKALSNLALPKENQVINAWGAIDGTCDIVSGVGLLLSQSSEPIANRAKGVTKLISSGQLFFLISLGLGPIGYAVSVGVAFTHSLYDTLKLLRRINEPNYWLEDAHNKLMFMDEQHQELHMELSFLKNSDKNSYVTRSLIQRKEIKLAEVIQNHAILTKNIEDFKANGDNFTVNIKQNLQSECREKIWSNLLLGSAFIGAILLCVPGAQIAAMAFIAIAITIYAYKFNNKVDNYIDKLFATPSRQPKYQNVRKDDDEDEGDGEHESPHN
jgi:hypothetical protein